ncbi:putative MFS transporter [Aspergillus steynii IBT 23096]|uniref:Putative MFS transporter n=1 Tax=Aspergillus steynii IBT 23096 TaxID=1392250 RepID=A0A2I2GBX2_9EURO|nr:putative MFS transporter [Aspergillus steynii IBT 23096]PLB50373.1 putative MFS transporter [Aspergillus steynii IBT 23096]
MGDPESQTTTTAIKSPQNGYELPFWRKSIILFVVSWMTLAVTFSSTSLLPATPEIAAEFHTTSETLNITNAGVLLAMGFSSLIWGPLNHLIGRRMSFNIAILFLCACSAGTAAAVDMKMFTAFRVLGGLTGTSFMVSGQTILADIFEPVVRGTAVGFFMAGTVTGPAIGPCIGGIIVTFASWRNIYWLQVAMTGFGLILSLLFVPELKSQGKAESTTDEKTDQEPEKPKHSALSVIRMFNPIHIVRLLIYPNILLADLTCGLLSTFQYTILTSARSIFNPRFHLTTALISGLFYLAPGAGFLVGSIVGGKFSDRTVRKWIARRDGLRLPQDRLHSGLATLFGVLPAAALVYGWTLDQEKGGMAVPIVAAFFGGWGLMGSFNGLNTYCAEVLPHKRSEVISGKYIIQYIFSAGASALVQPVINHIGVGWTFTICVIFSIIGGFLVLIITKWGIDMQRAVERKVPIPGAGK